MCYGVLNMERSGDAMCVSSQDYYVTPQKSLICGAILRNYNQA